MNGSWPDYIYLFFETPQWGSSLGVKSEVWSYRTLWAGPGHPSAHTSLLKLPVTCPSWLWNHCSGPEFSFTDTEVFPGDSVVKSLPANARDMGLIPGSGRSPGIGNGSSVQFSDSVMSNSFLIPWTAARQASLPITIFWSLLNSMSIESVMQSNHHILCHSLLLLPSIFPIIRVFSNELALRIRWPKYWSFTFNISPSNEHPGNDSPLPYSHLGNPMDRGAWCTTVHGVAESQIRLSS